MEHQDQTIACSDCGHDFTFTAGEQQFYAERGFEHPPKRCKPCRALRKQQQGSTRPQANAGYTQGATRGAGTSGPRPRQAPHQANHPQRESATRPRPQRDTDQRSPQPRDVHVTTCQACGITTKVPFKPQEGRGVYCPECYQALKALSRSSMEEETS